MKHLTAIGIAFALSILSPGAGLAFDETDQAGQRRFKSMSTCAGCHLLQPGSVGPVKMIGANLLGSDLRGLNLRAADLRRANMRGVDLRDVDLTGARLKGAMLRGADLRRANLAKADLQGADLTGANLAGADLRGANLSQADLTKVSLVDVNLDNVTYCQTIMPTGKIENPDCKWWQMEAPRMMIKPPEETATPAAPSGPTPSVDAKEGTAIGTAAAREQISTLSRFFNIQITRPDSSEEALN